LVQTYESIPITELNINTDFFLGVSHSPSTGVRGLTVKSIIRIIKPAPRFTTLLLLFLVVLHIRLPTHKGEIPGGLSMRDTATKVPFPLEVMFPVVIINITRFRHVYAIQAETMKVVREFTANCLDSGHTELGSTGHACLLWHGALEFEESWTVKDLLDRFLVVVMKGPNASLAKTLVVCEQ
jgi:hypothetical protein